MTLDIEIQKFFSDLIGRAQNPRLAIEYCNNKRQTASPFLKVLAASLLWIFFEIKDYLDQFEASADRYALPLEEIETERKKIHQLVITSFAGNPTQKDGINSQDEVLLVIENFILNWDNHPKFVFPESV